MHRILRRRPSPAFVVACLALFVAMAGTGWAASQISGSTLLNRSVSHKKLKLNTLTGREIKESKLGQVPSAATADNATHAIAADNATHATAATSATHATSADSATLASSLPSVQVQPLAFLPGWGTSSFLARAPAFTKDAQGFVHLQGAVARTSGSSNDIATLPVGARPAALSYMLVYAANDTVGTLWVDPNGVIMRRTGDVTFLSLEGLSFHADH
jgi:hypothetical protein